MSDLPERQPFAAPEIDWSAARAFVRERIRCQWDRAEEAALEERTDDALVRLARRLRADPPPPVEDAMAAAAARSVLEQLRGRRRWAALQALATGARIGRAAAVGGEPIGDPLARFRFLALAHFARDVGAEVPERVRLAISNHPKPPITLPDLAPLDWAWLARRFARALAHEPVFAPLASWTARAGDSGVPSDEVAAHAWFGARILPFLTGLLRPAEDALFREFGDRDGHCRFAFAPFAEGAGEPADLDGHVPPPVLVRWAEAAHDLGPAEARTVRAHVAECAECRDDLAALGLELRALEAGVASTRRSPIVSRRERALLGWSIAATGLALLLGALLLQPRHDPDRIDAAAGGDPSVATVAAVEPVGMPHLVLGGPRRARASTALPAALELSGREPLFVRVPDLPAAVQAVVVVLDDPAGRPVASERLAVSRINAAFQLAIRPAVAWGDGTYRLRLLAPDDATPLYDWAVPIRRARE